MTTAVSTTLATALVADRIARPIGRNWSHWSAPLQDWRGAFLVLLGPHAFQRRHDEKVDAKRPELINWFVVDCCLDALSEYGSHFRLGPHAECYRHDRRVLPCGENLPVPTSPTIAAAISTDSYSSAPLFASPGNDVFDTGSDLPRFATTVRLSGGSGRFACCRAGFYLNFLGPAKFGLCATYGMGFQCLGHARFTRCHYSCDDLRSTCIYGTGLLDSRVLGACSVGYPLHHLRCPNQALARSNVNFLYPCPRT